MHTRWITPLALAAVVGTAAVFVSRPAVTAADEPAAATQPARRVTESGLTIIEVNVPAGDTLARTGDIVLVHYTGTLTDGKKFDSSFDHPGKKPIQFTIGAHKVIAGWEEGIAGMKIGQKRQLVIPPALGYRDQAMGDIPANSTLHFDVHLVGIVRLPE